MCDTYQMRVSLIDKKKFKKNTYVLQCFRFLELSTETFPTNTFSASSGCGRCIDFICKILQHFLSSSKFRTPFQIAQECTIQLPCFHFFLGSSNFQNTISNSTRVHHFFFFLSICFRQFVSNSVRMYHISSLISKCLQLFQLHKNLILIASNCTIYSP